MGEIQEMRMFPLGTVLFPHALVPLHIFEPRYRTMISEALDEDREFGVVLIERGSAESTSNVPSVRGSVARIVSHEVLDDGRMLVLGVGTRRFEVVEWLDDRPYPHAAVQMLERLAPVTDLSVEIETCRRLLRRILALASELGHDVEIKDLELTDDQTTAVWELCAAAPLGDFDRQRLLVIDDPGERLTLLLGLLGELAADLEARIGCG